VLTRPRTKRPKWRGNNKEQQKKKKKNRQHCSFQ